MSECGCKILNGLGVLGVGQMIEYCDLHRMGPELLEALESVAAWFERMRKDHDTKLGTSFVEACENWDKLLQEPLNMEPILQAIAKARGEGTKQP